MRYLWLIPLVVLILLLGAWPFRWVKETTQSFGGTKVFHLRDRWTGQRWVAVYGIVEGEMLSGEERPILAEAKISARQESILNGPQGEKRRERLEARIQEAQQEKERRSAGHTQYLRLEKQLKHEFELKAYSDGLIDGLDFAEVWTLEGANYIRSKMPPELIKECEAWRAADRLIPKLYEEIERLPEWARNEAERQLTREAYLNRKIATGVWAGLVGVSLLLTVALFIRERRLPRPETTTPSGSPEPMVRTE